ncbi:MAG: helix-turn-helix domain-containing protein [Gammaproteobacteria bacterium]
MASSKPTELQLVSSSGDAAADGDHIELLTGLERLRVETKFTREDVASHLHLSTSIVAAIEENRFTDLPEPTYVKGYLRSYAQLLGLDPDLYVRAYNKLGIADPALDFAPQPQTEFGNNLGLKWGTAGIAVLLTGSLTTWWLNETRQPELVWDSQAQFSVTEPGLAPVVTEVERLELRLPTTGDVRADAEPESDEVGIVDNDLAAGSAEPSVRIRKIISESASTVIDADDPAPLSVLLGRPVVTEDTGSLPMAEVMASAAEAEAHAATETAAPVPTPMPAIARLNEQARTVRPFAPVSAKPAPARESPRRVDSGTSQLLTRPGREQSAPGKDALQLKFSQASWVEIYDANNVRVLYALIPPDTSRTITGTAPFNAIIGNAPGVEIEINDRPFDVSPHVRRDNTARLTIKAPGADL